MSSIIKNLSLLRSTNSFYIQIRNKRFSNFIPIQRKDMKPELYFSLEERLNENNERLKDPEIYEKVNIGFACKSDTETHKEKSRIIQSLKKNTELEKEAHRGTLMIDLETVEKEWRSSLKPYQIKELAENCDIYKHLFGEFAHFYPVVIMNILYDYNEELLSPVYYGNLLKPKEAESTPTVQFKSDSDSLWTLIFTSPDDNLLETESEMIHWFIGNIPGNDIVKGEEIVDYMRPIPPKGSGFHRYCFLLYKQNDKIDFSNYKKDKPCLSLQERTFSTYDFYKEFEDHLTPAGLSWFQADYDDTLLDFFHNTLQMKNPIYQYEFPKPYIRPQELFPHLRPFNRYMDLHRDPKEMQRLILLKRLKNVHPFQGEKPLYPFPQALPVPKDWSIWQKNEIANEREGKGRYQDMYRGDDRPYLHEGKAVTKVLPFKKLK